MNEEVFIEKFELLKEQVLESSAFQGWQSFFVPIKDVGEEGSTLGPFQGVTLLSLCGVELSDFNSVKAMFKFVRELQPPTGVPDPINSYGPMGERKVIYYQFRKTGTPGSFLEALEKRTVQIDFDTLRTTMGNYNPTPALPAASPPSPTLPYENLRKRQETPGSPQKSGGKKPKSVREKKTKSQLEEYLNGIVDDGGLETSRTPMKVSETDKVTRSDSRDAKLIHTLLKLLRVESAGQDKLLHLVNERLQRERKEKSSSNLGEDIIGEDLREVFSTMISSNKKRTEDAASGRKAGGAPPVAERDANRLVAFLIGQRCEQKKPGMKQLAKVKVAKSLGVTGTQAEFGIKVAENMAKNKTSYDAEFKALELSNESNSKWAKRANSKRLILDRYHMYTHLDDEFPFDNNLGVFKVGGRRKVWYKEVKGKMKRRWKREGAENHPGRSRGAKTIADIRAGFLNHYLWKSLPEEVRKIGFSRNAARGAICKCLKTPKKEVCCNEIVQNALLLSKATMETLKDLNTNGMSTPSTRQAGVDFGKLIHDVEECSKPADLAKLTLCPPIHYRGLDCYKYWNKEGDEKFWAPPFACAMGRCAKGECGASKKLENLRNAQVKERILATRKVLNKSEKIPTQFFGKVKRENGTSVVELQSKDLEWDDLVERTIKSLDRCNAHLWDERWTRQALRVSKENQQKKTADGSFDYTKGMSFCSMKSLTCAADNHGYCEIFVVSFNRRSVGPEGAKFDIWDTIVFYFFGGASSKYKDNDHRAHNRHVKEVCRIMKDKFGIEHINFESDGCPTQYRCKEWVEWISKAYEIAGVTVTHVFHE